MYRVAKTRVWFKFGSSWVEKKYFRVKKLDSGRVSQKALLCVEFSGTRQITTSMRFMQIFHTHLLHYHIPWLIKCGCGNALHFSSFTLVRKNKTILGSYSNCKDD